MLPLELSMLHIRPETDRVGGGMSRSATVPW